METELKPLISCQLCHKMLTDPKYLPCLHTYCQSCINKKARETLHSESTRTFSCPKCSRVVKLQNEVKTTTLADYFPNNELAANLIEGYHLKSGNVNCKPCIRKQKSTRGTRWCSKCKEPFCDSCFEHHKSFKTTMGHGVKSISELQSLPLKELLVMPLCEEHKEDLDFYCKEHNEFICSSCKSKSHRSCKSVSSTTDYAKTIREASNKLKRQIGQHERNSKIILENRMREKEVLESTKSKISQEISLIRKKITEFLVKYEKQCLEELEEIYRKEKQILETDTIGAEGVYKTSRDLNQVHKAASKHAHDVHFVDWNKKIEQETRLLNDVISEIHEPMTSTEIEFKVNPDLEKVIQSVQSIGGFSVRKEKVNLISRVENSDDTVSIKNKICDDKLDTVSMLSLQLPAEQYNVRTHNDEHACFITGMAMLPSNTLVCADKSNSKLKVFGENFQLQHEHELEFSPFDLVRIGGRKVAVTIPAESVIMLFDVGINIVYKKSIETEDACYGIAYSNKRYAYTCALSKPACVRMITETGEPIMTICPEENYQPLFLRPWYAKFDQNGSHLYVSDCNRAQVFCCIGSSLRRFAYANSRLNAPRGITLKQNDDFFVVGWASDNMHFVNRNGEFIREVVNRWNGTFSPQTVCLSEKEDKIFLSLDPTSCNGDVLLVFDLPNDTF